MREVRYAMPRTGQLVWTRFEATSRDRRPDRLVNSLVCRLLLTQMVRPAGCASAPKTWRVRKSKLSVLELNDEQAKQRKNLGH